MTPIHERRPYERLLLLSSLTEDHSGAQLCEPQGHRPVLPQLAAELAGLPLHQLSDESLDGCRARLVRQPDDVVSVVLLASAFLDAADGAEETSHGGDTEVRILLVPAGVVARENDATLTAVLYDRLIVDDPGRIGVLLDHPLLHSENRSEGSDLFGIPRWSCVICHEAVEDVTILSLAVDCIKKDESFSSAGRVNRSDDVHSFGTSLGVSEGSSDERSRLTLSIDTPIHALWMEDRVFCDLHLHEDQSPGLLIQAVPNAVKVRAVPGRIE